MFDDQTGQELLSMHAQKDMSRIVNNRDAFWVGENQLMHIKGENHLRVESEKRDLVKEDYSLTVSQTLHIKTEENMLIVNGSEYHVKAGSKVTLDAGCELTLQAGGNFIKIDASGIQTSAIVNMGMGSPGKGTEWNGQLPDELTPSQGKLTLGKIRPNRLI
ncbi:bacteriophage T4 gp5 trimerization domain-containing protein [Buttiauxella agrestis]